MCKSLAEITATIKLVISVFSESKNPKPQSTFDQKPFPTAEAFCHRCQAAKLSSAAHFAHMAVKTASQKAFGLKLQNKGHKINQMADLQRKTERKSRK